MKKAVSRVYMTLIFVFLYAPILLLVVFSFNDTDTKSRTVWSGFSLRWYEMLFQDRMLLEALRNTLIIAVCAAVGATILGTVAALGIHSMKSWRKKLVMNITNLPMLNPEIVTGVSLMLLMVFVANLFGVTLGIVSIILAHITFCLPYVILSVLPKLGQMDPHLFEAAQDLGCTPVRSFFKVVLPEIMSGVITGMVMAFTLSLDDFIISYFCSGTTQTLPVFIYSMTKKRVSPEINALSTLLFAVILILLLIINIRQGRMGKKAKKEADV
ncbi:MAG: ABC transporter permease [Hydrogeniiclostridium sp.]|jgi:spermidine/putrescine transport system permease protein